MNQPITVYEMPFTGSYVERIIPNGDTTWGSHRNFKQQGLDGESEVGGSFVATWSPVPSFLSAFCQKTDHLFQHMSP